MRTLTVLMTSLGIFLLPLCVSAVTDSGKPLGRISQPILLEDNGQARAFERYPLWVDFNSNYGCQSTAVWNLNSRTPHRVVTSGILLSPSLDDSNIEKVSRDFVQANSDLLGVGLADLSLQAAGFHGRMWYVIFDRYYQNLPVYNARVNFTYAANGNLVSFGSDAYPGISVDTAPNLSEQDAVGVVRASIDYDSEQAKVEMTQLLVLPLELEGSFSVHLAWKVVYLVPDAPARWFMFIDAHTGEVLMYWDGIAYDFTGNVNGDVQLEGAYSPFYNRPFKDLTVDSGFGSDETDANGDYLIAGGGTTTITAQILGPYLNVNNQMGADASFSNSSDGQLDINWTSISHPAERDAYYHAIDAHDYIKYVDPFFTGMDWQVGCNVNIDASCNAYWDGSSINFYREGGGCGNTGQMLEVVHHEYGHGITQFFYAPIDLPYEYETGGLNEGWSDFIANCMTDQPLMGRGWSGPGTYLRSSDNSAQYPGTECGGEPHCMGDIIVGALWDMRVNLVNSLGPRAKTYVDSLWHHSRYAKPMTYLDYLWEILLYDDDDGNPLNGTPNYTDICDGFAQHNMDCPELALLAFTYPGGLPESVWPNGGTTVRVEVSAVTGNPQPNTGVLHYNSGSGYQTVPMTVVAPNVYDAVFPAVPCPNGVAYYFSAQTDQGQTATDPMHAPTTSYSTISAYEFIVTFQDSFETEQGWTVVNSPGLTDGAWTRGVPAGGGERGDPPTDYDGSGQCYLTDNVYGNSDVDDGSTYLISPTFDLTSTNAIIKYALWYTNNAGNDPNNDVFRTWASSNNGSTWVIAETVGPVTHAVWNEHSFIVGNHVTPTSQVKIRFEASDLAAGSVVEAGVDAFSVTVIDCQAPGFAYLSGDVNMYVGSWPPEVIGSDVTYFVNFLRAAPTSQQCLLGGFWASADANGDCEVLGSDVTRLVNYFRGTIGVSFCPDFEPLWPTPGDLPVEPPSGWPNCETIQTVKASTDAVR